jgi:MoxR-like ATPase
MKTTLDEAIRQLDQIIVGKSNTLRLAMCCLLARGHLLIEDIPGVGKTTMARALSRSLGLDLRRVQFTSDLLPADIIGGSIFDKDTQKFVFHAGPIFSQIVLGDEINRATPKTQSALLEAMEEDQVTADGYSHPLPKPFFVIATQNPHHLIGTYPLPESQLDRFLMRLELGFPGREAEKLMMAGRDRKDLIQEMKPSFTGDQIIQFQDAVEKIHIADPLRDYILDLIGYTRQNPKMGFGLSPRASLALQRSAQAWAFMAGREMVIPEDVQAVAPSVMSHRLRSSWDASSPGGNHLVEEILKTVAIP